ncbi:hypothetical protein JNW88_10540 [Micromonospora sp. ATA32]|nr:hypothetical protein [Micromonospora sp. ATA32]
MAGPYPGQVDEGPDQGIAPREWLPRTAALLVGTLALATAFIAAYVGALHQPTARDVPVGVVLGDQRAQSVLAAVRGQTDKIKPIGYDNPDEADGLTARKVYGVLTSTPDGGLTLTIASASAPSATDLIVGVLTQAAQHAQAPLRVVDEVPVEQTDPRGLVPDRRADDLGAGRCGRAARGDAGPGRRAADRARIAPPVGAASGAPTRVPPDARPDG